MSGYTSESSTISSSSRRSLSSGGRASTASGRSRAFSGSNRTHAAKLSTVGGFPAGSGRDTFLSWNSGGRNKEYHCPGKDRHTFETRLRNSVNSSRTPSERRRPRTVSCNPTGRFRPRPPKIINDGEGSAYGKPSIQPGQFSVALMFSEMKVAPSPHSCPKENAKKKFGLVQRHVNLMKNARGGRDPVAERRSKFLEVSRRRQAEAAKWERHTRGRMRKRAKSKGFRICHQNDNTAVIDHRFG